MNTNVNGKNEAGSHDVPPWFVGRRLWVERFGSEADRTRQWRLAAAAGAVVSTILATGLVMVSLQHKVVPYTVQIDGAGRIAAVERADVAKPADERVMKALLARFVEDVRGVVLDGQAQRAMIERTYTMLANNTPALVTVNEYYKAAPPNKRAQTGSVSVAITTVLPVSDKSWQVDWVETARDPSGAVLDEKRWKATVQVQVSPPTTEAQIQKNPIGLFVTNLAWSPVL